MPELRWNPLLQTWTMVAGNRQNRPNMPAYYCPFCPESGKVPSDFDVLVYPNDFPALSTHPEPIEASENELFEKKPAYGSCEVILYSPKHDINLYELSDDHIYKLIQLWADRTTEISKDPNIKYVFPFENRGKEVGVTMPHPHGQIYGYSYIPLKLEVELKSAKSYFEKNKTNLFDAIIWEEQKVDKRIIFETKNFLVFLPFFTDYPYGVFIVAKNDAIYFSNFSENEKKELGIILKDVVGMFDALYDKPFPYMMCVHQAPVNSEEWENSSLYYRFHIEFYPPLRSSDAIKYYASSEMGAWAAANTRNVEETALELKIALKKYKNA